MNDQSADEFAASAAAARGLACRRVCAADLDLIVRHRRAMFAANGHEEAVLAPMARAFAAWLAPRLARGDYFGWVVEDQTGDPLASLGMIVIDWPPHPLHPNQDRRGYILNVFVEPALRGEGVAVDLMGRAVAEARRRGLALLALHASAMGRPLYERLGWRAGTEMILPLDA